MNPMDDKAFFREQQHTLKQTDQPNETKIDA